MKGRSMTTMSTIAKSTIAKKRPHSFGIMTIMSLLLFLLFSFPILTQEVEEEQGSQEPIYDVSLGVLIAEKGTGVATSFQAQSTNAQGDILSTRTGLFFFSGDRLETKGEIVDILVPEVLTVITLNTFTRVRFNAIQVSPVEIIAQLIVEEGQAAVETLDVNTVYQRLSEIYFNDLPRPDKKVSNNSNVQEIHFHVGYDDSIVEIRNVDQRNNVFITHADVNIEEYIKSYQEYAFASDPDLQRIFSPKPYPQQPTITTGFEIRNGIHKLQDYVLDVNLHFALQYKKFATSLSVFGVYWRNPLLYNPYGNPLSFGLDPNEAQRADATTLPLLHQTYQLLSDTLMLVDYVQYGISRDDSIYFYFGRPQYWNTMRSPSLVYKYKPMPSAQNNVNLDLELNINLGYFGNRLYMRSFAPYRIADPWLEEWDIILNRTWFRPIETVPGFEFGLSLGGDFNLGKYTPNDTNEFTSAITERGALSLALYGLDISIPIAYRPRWISELVVDGAGHIILQNNGTLILPVSVQYQGLTNFSVGSSFRNRFSNIGQDFTIGFSFNTYLSRGIAKAHYFSFGHEYNTKYKFNRAFSNFIQNPSDPIFNTFVLTPEFELNFELQRSLQLDVGATIPLSIFNVILQNLLGAGTPITNNYSALELDESYVYFDFSWELASISSFSEIRIGTFLGIYLTDIVNQNFDLSSGTAFFSQSVFNGKNLIDFYAETTIIDLILLRLGYASEPEYNTVGVLSTNESGNLPRIVHYPYFTIGFQFTILK